MISYKCANVFHITLHSAPGQDVFTSKMLSTELPNDLLHYKTDGRDMCNWVFVL